MTITTGIKPRLVGFARFQALREICHGWKGNIKKKRILIQALLNLLGKMSHFFLISDFEKL